MPSDKKLPRDPARRRFARAFGRLSLAAILLGYAGLAFVSLYRPDPSDGMGPVETLCTWLSLMGTTFLPHAGMALAGVLLACLVVRARRAALAGLPLLAVSLGPWAWSFLPIRGPIGGPNGAPASGLSGGPSSGAAGVPVAAPGGDPPADTMLVLSANLFASTRSDEPLLSQIAAHRPDVILIQEVRDASAQRLQAALAGEYAFIAIPREDNFGQAIYSRLPFTRDPLILPRNARSPLPQVAAFVEFAGREVCVWNVHLMSPLDLERTGEQARMAWELGAQLDDLAAAGIPTIVGGDFNSVWRAQPLDALRARGYRDAQREAGSGPGETWPRITVLRHAPGIALDHIAYGRGLECVGAWTGEDTGSDHKPVFARLAPGSGW